MKFFSFSFLWGFFQWFYTGKEGCGFSQFPTFGLEAWKHTSVNLICFSDIVIYHVFLNFIVSVLLLASSESDYYSLTNEFTCFDGPCVGSTLISA